MQLQGQNVNQPNEYRTDGDDLNTKKLHKNR